jgi:hypothetical protein
MFKVDRIRLRLSGLSRRPSAESRVVLERSAVPSRAQGMKGRERERVPLLLHAYLHASDF